MEAEKAENDRSEKSEEGERAKFYTSQNFELFRIYSPCFSFFPFYFPSYPHIYLSVRL